MKTLKSLILLLAVGLGLTACNSSFEENKILDAPESLPFGVYKLSQSDAQYNYYLVHMMSASNGTEGLVVYRENLNPEPDDSPWRVVVSAYDTDGYDQSVGVLICRSQGSYYGDGTQGTQDLLAEVSLLAPNAYTSGYQYQILVDQAPVITGTAELTDLKFLPVLPSFALSALDENNPDLFKLLLFYPDGTGAGFLSYDDYENSNVATYDYTYDEAANSLTITLSDGTEYTGYVNEDNHIVIVDAAGTEYILDPYYSDPEPEQFDPLGNIQITLDCFSVTASPWDSYLYRSQSNPDKYKVDPLFVDGFTVCFYDDADGIYLDLDTNIGLPLNHSSYGQYFMRSAAYGTYNRGIYNFPVQLYVSAGTFSGTYNFTVDTTVPQTGPLSTLRYNPKKNRTIGEKYYVINADLESPFARH